MAYLSLQGGHVLPGSYEVDYPWVFGPGAHDKPLRIIDMPDGPLHVAVRDGRLAVVDAGDVLRVYEMELEPAKPLAERKITRSGRPRYSPPRGQR